MVETRVRTKVVERTARPSLGVHSAEDERANARGDKRSCTHRARFEGHHERGIVQTPGAEDPRRLLDRQYLRVRRGVGASLSFVVRLGDGAAPDDHDCADRDVTVERGGPRLLQRKPHGGLVRQKIHFHDRRRRWDLNPWTLAGHTISSRADSAALALLRTACAASGGYRLPGNPTFCAAAGSCATCAREPSQGRKAAALSVSVRVPQ